MRLIGRGGAGHTRKSIAEAQVTSPKNAFHLTCRFEPEGRGELMTKSLKQRKEAMRRPGKKSNLTREDKSKPALAGGHHQASTSLGDFLICRVMTNFLIWLIAFLIFAVAPRWTSWIPKVDFDHFLDWSALGVFVVGAVLVVCGAWVIGRLTALSLIATVREETSTALLNICSILLVPALFGVRPLLIVAAVVGYLVAWRL